MTVMMMTDDDNGDTNVVGDVGDDTNHEDYDDDDNDDVTDGDHDDDDADNYNDNDDDNEDDDVDKDDDDDRLVLPLRVAIAVFQSFSELRPDDDADDNRENHVLEEGDAPIYDPTTMWANVDESKNLQMQCMVYNSPTNPVQPIPSFEALCGLIHVNIETGTSPILFLDVEGQGRGF